MGSFPILDLVAGIIFVYFLLSIISSSAVEIVLTLRNIRAKMMTEWLYEIFQEKLAKEIMNHDCLKALSDKDISTSYIDAKNFTTVLIEKITYDANNPNSIAQNLNSIVSSLEKTTILTPELKRAMLVYAAEAKDTFSTTADKAVSEIGLFRGKIESWFDSNMDRVTGKLKSKHSRKLTFWLGALIVISLNADTVAIAKYLYDNPEARIAMAQKANDATNDTAFQNKINQITAALDTSSDVQAKNSIKEIKESITYGISNIKANQAMLQEEIPLSWNSHALDDENGKFSIWLLIQKIFGLLASILAVMMGAPFWFDVLNKISNLRGAGKKPEESPRK